MRTRYVLGTTYTNSYQILLRKRISMLRRYRTISLNFLELVIIGKHIKIMEYKKGFTVLVSQFWMSKDKKILQILSKRTAFNYILNFIFIVFSHVKTVILLQTILHNILILCLWPRIIRSTNQGVFSLWIFRHRYF